MIDALLQWTAAHQGWAGLIVFVTACAESLAVVGLFIPGVVLMFGIGAMITVGSLEFLPTVAWAAAGAIVGDGLSYLLGRVYHQQLRTLWPFRTHPKLIARGNDFFARHGGKSILLGRFVGPIRPVIPAIAGMLNMPAGRFFAINILSALLWAPAYLLPGMAFAASHQIAGEMTARLGALLLALALLLWLTWRIARGLYALLQPHTWQLLEAIMHWSRLHPRMLPVTGPLADPTLPEARGLTLLAIALLVLFTVVYMVAAATFGLPTALDLQLHDWLASLRNPIADPLLVATTMLGDTVMLVPVALLVLGLLLAQRDRVAAMHWLAALGFALVAPLLLKTLFQIERPDLQGMAVDGLSFPSSHATRATVIYSFLTVLVARAVPISRRWMPYGIGALLVIAVAFSRPYLGVHWPGDVVAGLLLGLTWVVLLGTAYRVRAAHAPRPLRLAVIVCVTLPLLGAGYIGLRLDDEIARYTPTKRERAMAFETWRDGPWQAALRAGDRPLSLQWAATGDQIARSLRATGWREAPPVSAVAMLAWLNPNATLQNLPVLPHVSAGHFEASRWIRDADDEARQVLRLWDSGVHLTRPDRPALPLWFGTLEVQHVIHPLGLLSYARPTPNPATHLAALLDAPWTIARESADSDRLRVYATSP